MVPIASAVEEELVAVARSLFHNDRDGLTVNAVRSLAEESCGLEPGFLKSNKWKNKSKTIINDTVVRTGRPRSHLQAGAFLEIDANYRMQNELIAGEEVAAAQPSQTKSEDEPPKKKSVKRKSSDEGTATKKRVKVNKKAESDLSDLDEKPTKKRNLAKRKRATVSDDEDDNFEGESLDAKVEAEKPEVEQKQKREADSVVAKKLDDSDESSPLSDVKDEEDEKMPAPQDDASELSEVIDEPPKRKRKPKGAPPPKRRKSKAEDEKVGTKKTKMENKKPVANDDSDSSLSSVLDEPPKQRRKSKESSRGAPKPKPSAKSTADLAPDEVEIKKLQGQLVKCGIRKIWAFELKEYADDAKAKIRHLRGMLKEIGIDGRFSEAKAREIKERRELQADLEAVQHMNSHWGAGKGRASRSRAKLATKDGSGEEDDHDEAPAAKAHHDRGEGDDDEEETKPFSRSKGSSRYKADLAFLGSESESE